jgi:hypothetical protein
MLCYVRNDGYAHIQNFRGFLISTVPGGYFPGY